MTPESRQEATRNVHKILFGSVLAFGAALLALFLMDVLRPSEVQLLAIWPENDLRFIRAETTLALPFVDVELNPEFPFRIDVEGFYTKGRRVNGTVKFCPIMAWRIVHHLSQRMNVAVENDCFVVQDPGTSYYATWDNNGIGVYMKEARQNFDFKTSPYGYALLEPLLKQFEVRPKTVNAESPSYPEVTGIDFATYDAPENFFEEGLVFVNAEKTEPAPPTEA